MTTLKFLLEENNIYNFKSLKEVINFQKSYNISRQELISNHQNLIEHEKNMLDMDLPILDAAIEIQRQQTLQRLTKEINELKKQLNTLTSNTSKNFFQTLTNSLRYWNYKRKIKRKEDNFEFEVKTSTTKLAEDHQTKSNRLKFIKSHFNEAVKQSAQHSLSELERKKHTIDGFNNFIYGALGEQKVVRTLETLSDEYFLINDFTASFSPPIYNRQENDYIKSVQIDHILVGPSGIFLIETKNWSEKSIQNLSLRSPVEQIKRTSFVLFYLLNNERSNYHLNLESHHWGNKKIPIKNIIALTNTKPKEEFQYVKILTVEELLSYVNYFKPIFSNIETERIADMILSVNK